MPYEALKVPRKPSGYAIHKYGGPILLTHTCSNVAKKKQGVLGPGYHARWSVRRYNSCLFFKNWKCFFKASRRSSEASRSVGGACLWKQFGPPVSDALVTPLHWSCTTGFHTEVCPINICCYQGMNLGFLNGKAPSFKSHCEGPTSSDCPAFPDVSPTRQ